MKKIIISMALVSVVSAPALAGLGLVGQTQDFGVALNNTINLFGGQQQAASNNFQTIVNNQFAKAPHPTTALQNQVGFFNQVGQACGQCATIGLVQNVVGMGAQLQNIGAGVLPKTETQLLSLTATQLLTKQDGGGTVTGNQTMSIAQDQNAANNAGPMGQSSVVFGQQTTSLSGMPGSTGMAGATAAVTTSQTQLVN